MTNKINKLLILIILFIPLLLLTSCWDYIDVNKKCIAISIGVDYVNNNIEFSGEIARLTSSSNDKNQKSQCSNVYKLLSYGKTFEEARVHYNSFNPFSVFLGATRVVVFGQNFAKRGIEPYLNRIDSLYDYRKTLLAVVSREPPRDLFNVKVEKDLSVGFLIEDIIDHLNIEGESIYPQVGELLSTIALEQVGYVLPYVGIENNTIKYLGLAVMKDSKLIDIIKLTDTKCLICLIAKHPQITKILKSTKNEKNKYSFQLLVKKRKISTDYINNKVIININLDLSSKLRYQYFTQPISDKDLKGLEETLSKQIKNEINAIIKKAQNEFKCDIFSFAKYFRAEHPDTFKKINWADAFTVADVNINVHTKIINMNLYDPNAEKK